MWELEKNFLIRCFSHPTYAKLGVPKIQKYRVINLILPYSKRWLWHFFTNKQAGFLGDFNHKFWYILLFEIRFLIFKKKFLAQNHDISKGPPYEKKNFITWKKSHFLKSSNFVRLVPNQAHKPLLLVHFRKWKWPTKSRVIEW